MAFRAKNHELKTYGTPKKVKRSNEQQKMLSEQQQLDNALKLHEETDQQINRAFKIVLPIIAFLIAAIAANMPIYSFIATFVMSTVAFLAVGIKKHNILAWVAVLASYAIIDNLLSYGTLNPSGLSRHLGTMLIFLALIHYMRPFFGKWVVRSKLKQQEKSSS